MLRPTCLELNCHSLVLYERIINILKIQQWKLEQQTSQKKTKWPEKLTKSSDNTSVVLGEVKLKLYLW